MGFFVFGLSHKSCPVEIRERFHFDPVTQEEALKEFRQAFSGAELLILSTCNRVECFGFSESGPDPAGKVLDFIARFRSLDAADFRPYLITYEGKDAVRHMFRVAAGLESMVVGENEILGQLRDAFRLAARLKTAHSFLYRLAEKALKIGKDVRTGTRINEGAVSISSVAVELAGKIFGRLSGQKVLVLGTGEMSTLTLQNLHSAGADALCVVSRNRERGEEMASRMNTRWVSIDSWRDQLKLADIVIASTASPEPIVSRRLVAQAMGARRHRPLFLIDIAVPRDIEPAVNDLDDVYLYNIDDLKTVADANLRFRRGEVDAAEEKVSEAVRMFGSWMEQLSARPTLERFERKLDRILEDELETALRNRSWTEEERQELRNRIRSKLLHGPFQRIKQASLNGGVQRYLEALDSLFDLAGQDKDLPEKS